MWRSVISNSSRDQFLTKTSSCRSEDLQAGTRHTQQPELRQRALTVAICGALALGLQAGLTSPAHAQAFPAKIELSSLDGSNGFVLNGEEEADYAGTEVSGAGDINGDGIDDLIVATDRSGFDRGYGEPGQSYVVFGSPSGLPAVFELSSLDGSNGFAIDGEQPGDSSGNAVSDAGDVNGDGIDDLIVGARTADANGNAYAGRAYIVFGDSGSFPARLDLSTLDGNNGFVINGETPGDYAGTSVSAAGDINGDGIADIVLGATRAEPNGRQSGRIYIVFGATGGFPAALDLSDLNGNNGFVLNGEAANDRAGYANSGAGDVNGDGIDDLIVGVGNADVDGLQSVGRSYVVFGSTSGLPAELELSSLNGSNGFVINGNDERDEAGRSVSGAGDVNGDGFADVIIGAPSADAPNNSSGQSFVVFGSGIPFPSSIELSSLNGSNGFVINGEGEDDRLGRSVSTAGDLNGDGIDDLIVSAPFADSPSSNAGRSYVLLGTRADLPATIELSGLNGCNGFVLNGQDEYERSGHSVSAAGDVNGDGIDDLIIGAPNASLDSTSYSIGRSYVVFGRDSLFCDGFETGF